MRSRSYSLAEAFLNDLQVEEAQEPAAKAKAKRGGAFHLEGEGGIVEAQFADALAQFLKVSRIHGEEAAEDHGLDFLIAGRAPRSRRS